VNCSYYGMAPVHLLSRSKRYPSVSESLFLLIYKCGCATAATTNVVVPLFFERNNCSIVHFLSAQQLQMWLCNWFLS